MPRMPTVWAEPSKNFVASHKSTIHTSKINLVRIDSCPKGVWMMTTLIKTIVMLRLFRASRFINCGVLILSVALVATAQAPGSSRGLSSGEGNHSIQGRVYFPAGQAVSKVVKVNLESNGQIGGMSTMTDEDGVFRFNSLPPGSYAVVVD